MLPNQTLVHANEDRAPGRKISKDRVTILACSNATGTMKLKPFVIGKSKNPRSFKNKTLAVDYAHSKSAWMNIEIFKKWFFSKFVFRLKIFLKVEIYQSEQYYFWITLLVIHQKKIW